MTVHSLTMTWSPWGAAVAAAKACLMWLASTGKAPWRVTRWTQEHRNPTDLESDFILTSQRHSVTFLHQDSDQCKKSSSRRVNKSHHSKGKSRHGGNDAAHSSGTGNCGMRPYVGLPPSYTGPKACLRFHTFWFISTSNGVCVAQFILDCFEFLTSPKIFYSCRIWQSSWNKLAVLSISPYLRSKTLTCGYFSPWLKMISKK